MDLDDLLAAAAPPVAPRDVRLRADLDDLIDRTEYAAVPSRRHRRLRVASLAVASVLAAGTGAAAASGYSPRWVPWHAEDGSTCVIAFDLHIHDGMNGEPMKPSTAAMTTAQKMEVLRAGRHFLDHFDYGSIDHERAIRLWKAAEDRAIAAEPAGERQPRDTGDDVDVDAVGNVVSARLTAYLERRGLNPDALVYGQGSRCER
ncbi:MAG: hypothetical protein ACTHNS_08370 [Marmoricola sp.]